MSIIGMKKTLRRQFASFFAASVLASAFGSATAADYLELSQTPLFSGTSAEPNVLVAVDDSGSMDMETLFPTDEGWLYWSDNNSAGADSNGTFYNSGETYGYLFPFDQILAQGLTIPPIPELAYARAADYNKAYFNPSPDINYTPWLSYEQSAPLNAPYDPEDDNGAINLTLPQAGAFYFQKNMVIPGGSAGAGNAQLPSINGNVCYNRFTGDIRAPIASFFGGYYCYINIFGGLGYGPNYLLTSVNNLPVSGDETVNSDGHRTISYFPATFYLKPPSARDPDDAALPANYGYKSEKTIDGKGPAGEELIGYEIKLENFDTPAQYQAAIENFANWFTYYRKRHLATRGGIVAAFDRIEDIRVAGCTINGRRDLSTGNNNLTMKSLNDTAERADFYSSVFAIDYATSRGTPNREALDYLGRQIEDNGSIISEPCQRNFSILFTDGYSNPTTSSGVGNVDRAYGSPFADGESNTIADIAMKYYEDLDTQIEGILRAPAACKEPNPSPRLNCKTGLHMVTFGVTLNQTGTIFNNLPQFEAQNRDPYTNAPNWPNANTGGRSSKQVDDLWHATVNSRGELLNAETPAEIADRFTTALQRILGDTGTASSVSLNSSSLTTDSAAYKASFTAGAWSGELQALPQLANGVFGEPLWQASKTLGDPDDANYTAPNQRVILTRAQNNCGNNGNRSTVPFRYAEFKSNCKPLTQNEVNFIRGDDSQERANGGDFRNRNGNVLGDIVHSSPHYVGAPNRVRYPFDWDDRLTQTNERTAEDVAGPYSAPDGSGFSQGSAKNRRPMVYVGANDGMLHGFDAETGQERLAYIPGNVVDGLADLTKSGYSHRYYVDASPVSGDVIIDKDWRTVLVGGLGAGGRSVYALDITDPSPSAFNESNTDVVLWEYEHEELGNTFGQPSIVRLHDGRWAAVFGNGYNSVSGSAQLFIVDIASGDLIRRIDTGAAPERAPDPCAVDVGLGGINIGLICDDGDDDNDDDDNRITICHNGKDTKNVSENTLAGHIAHGDTLGACSGGDRFPVCHRGTTDIFSEAEYLDHIGHTTLGECGSENDGDIVNGLGEVFPVDLDGDFITDYIYAGDLYGNVWKFDLTSQSKNNWEVAFDGRPLFTATDDEGNQQSITTQPQVGVHPYGQRYGVMVYFGTGKYLENSDRDAKVGQQNSFYGIWDLDVFTFNDSNGGKGTFSTSLRSDIPRARLQQQTITDTPDKNGDTYRLVSDEPVDYQFEDDRIAKANRRGWYINLDADEGELVTTDSRIEGDTIAFSTTIPNTEICTASGSGFFMLLDRGTGGRTDYPAFDLNGDYQLDKNDTFSKDGKNIGASGLRIGAGIPGEASHQTDPTNDTAYYIVPASDGSTRLVYTQRQPDRRRSWREIRR